MPRQQPSIARQVNPNNPYTTSSAGGEGPKTRGTKGGNGAWKKKRARHTRTSLKNGTGTAEVFDQTTAGRIERQKKFLKGLAEFGTIRAGCREADVDRRTYYNWIESHAEFKEAVEHALEEAVDDLEEVGLKRAKDKSDLLIMFFLKRFRPQYRDNYKAAVGKPEEEELQARSHEDVSKRLDILAQRQAEKLLTEGSKGSESNVEIQRSHEDVEDEDPDETSDFEVIPIRRKRA